MNYWHDARPFSLESGAVLQGITIAYHTYGQLNAAGDNVVWICHALTASSDAAAWWPGVVGTGTAIDPSTHFIVCANIIGSCYGSTGPLANDPVSHQPYYHQFPRITIRDMVKAHQLLRLHLGIKKIQLLMGGSMGGYQALEWTLMESGLIERLFLIATAAKETPWGIAIHAAQRLAIEADESFGSSSPTAGSKGLKAARAIAMLTYRNPEAYTRTQSETDEEKLDDFKAASYISYQGDKLVQRFNAYSYWHLSKAMDSHNIARGRGPRVVEILKWSKQPTLVIGITSDLLCPLNEMKAMAAQLPDARFHAIDSIYGHDGFLTEHRQITALFSDWLLG